MRYLRWIFLQKQRRNKIEEDAFFIDVFVQLEQTIAMPFVEIVQSFLEDLSEDYPTKLKNKILQAADMLERKSSVSK